jgi:hypothetical protein
MWRARAGARTGKALEIIYEQGLLPEPAYIFKHAVIQDVAYQSLLVQRRKELHRAVGYAIEDLYPDRLADHYEELVHHFWQGPHLPLTSRSAGNRVRGAFPGFGLAPSSSSGLARLAEEQAAGRGLRTKLARGDRGSRAGFEFVRNWKVNSSGHRARGPDMTAVRAPALPAKLFMGKAWEAPIEGPSQDRALAL